MRVYLVFVAVPVTAAWNAVVSWWVIRQARIRVMGPSAAKVLTAQILPSTELSRLGRAQALRAIASAMVRDT